MSNEFDVPLCAVCNGPMSDAQTGAHPSCMVECANCHEDFIPPRGVEREFCSQHCENRHKGDPCEVPCDYCDDDEEAPKQTVDVIASGYEWVCPRPDCETHNKEIAFSVELTCSGCGREFEGNPPNHAYA